MSIIPYTPSDPTPREPCSCCDYFSLPERGVYVICPVCFWEDERGLDIDTLDKRSAANGLTLRQARENFLKLGACKACTRKQVLAPDERGQFRHHPRDITLAEGIVHHARILGDRNIHLFKKPENAPIIESMLRRVSIDRQFHLQAFAQPVIDKQADQPALERSILDALATLFQFPNRANWDGARDWLSDLQWITGHPPTLVKGIVFLYLCPDNLFRASPFLLAMLLDLLADASLLFQRYSQHPFNLVIGPVDETTMRFITLLRIAPQVCGCGWERRDNR